MAKKINMPIYRFKGDILRKLRLSPDQKLRITFQDLDGNGFEIDDVQQIPTVEILEKRFPDSESIRVTAYFNEVPIKDEEIFLNESEHEQEEPEKKESETDKVYGLVQSVIKQQEILSELKFKNFVEITNMKLDGMKSQFESMLASKEAIFQERLELEKEKIRLESGIESEGLLYKALSNAIDQISPHLGDIATTLLEKIPSKESLKYKGK
jgi:hypothetical protein